jgi:hypothetical protein
MVIEEAEEVAIEQVTEQDKGTPVEICTIVVILG